MTRATTQVTCTSYTNTFTKRDDILIERSYFESLRSKFVLELLYLSNI